MPVKHDFSERFKREQFDGEIFAKGDFRNLVTCLCKLQSYNFFDLILCCNLFYTDGKAKDKTCINCSPNAVFIREINLEPTSYPVEFLDALFPVYNQKKVGRQNTPSIIYNEDFMKWSNEEVIELGMGDTCNPNFVPFTMDEL